MKTRIISINYTKLVKQAKEGHSAFTRAQNGDVYVSVKVQDKEPDQYGKDVAVLLNPSENYRGTKEAPSPQDGIFVGGGIILKPKTHENTPENPIAILDAEDDLPF